MGIDVEGVLRAEVVQAGKCGTVAVPSVLTRAHLLIGALGIKEDRVHCQIPAGSVQWPPGCPEPGRGQ